MATLNVFFRRLNPLGQPGSRTGLMLASLALYQSVSTKIRSPTMAIHASVLERIDWNGTIIAAFPW
ncbi:MAG: hypothetical protein ACJA00_004844 [Myxococcota bacterium]|jgi:hypothetical protein